MDAPAALRPAEKIIFLAALGLAALVWLSAQIHVGANTNVYWLTQAAQKFLSGQTMAQDFNGPNPPLCILIYIPPAWLARVLHIPLYSASFLYALALVGL